MRRHRSLVAMTFCLSFVVKACLDRPIAASKPETTNIVVDDVPQSLVNKIDLLFMVDNSQSMADKQKIMAQAVPALLDRLINPRCLDTPTGNPLSESYPCPTGEPEFRAIRDIHIGVISSSLGAFGAKPQTQANGTVVGAQCQDAKHNDFAYLLPQVRPALPSYQGQGFLWWDPEKKVGGTSTLGKLSQSFQTTVEAAGQKGCGYEASLESWYRFLVDPEPPKEIVVSDGFSQRKGVDEEILKQRKAFLRPDSLLVIAMLSDENDCSVADHGNGWRIASNEPLTRATADCDDDPDSPCCRPCASNESSPPQGCRPLSEDPNCTTKGPFLANSEDHLNLRCWQQKQRFGLDLLHPTSRYVSALTQKQIRKTNGELAPNPLFSGSTGHSRQPSEVFLAGIVGVPWQDIATEKSLTSEKLAYLTHEELTEKKRWDWLVPNKKHAPLDPLMVESVKPRVGKNPATGHSLAPPSSPSGTNPINGHEWEPTADLQYACTFPLSSTRDCEKLPDDEPCDCRPEGPGQTLSNNPLCQDPKTEIYSSVQHFAKAFPSTRQLEVIRAMGDTGIAASICPKTLQGSSSDPSYGYNPAVDAIIHRLRRVFQGRCLPRPIALSVEGNPSCKVVEAYSPGSCTCPIESSTPSAKLAAAVRKKLRESGSCGASGAPACSQMCLCELSQAEPSTGCAVDAKATGTGWCYIDPERGLGSPELVKHCPTTRRRMLRFLDSDIDDNPAVRVLACQGATTAP